MAEENVLSNDEVYFATEASAALFQTADVKHHFWTICRYFVSENMLTYCGIASSVTVLNSLDVPSPDDPQIYPYKMFTQENFFTDAVLQLRRPVEVEKNGCTLDQLAGMLAVFDVEVNSLHADTINAELCRTMLVDALQAEDKRVIVDFDRGTLGQKGGGHFSPLAAYHAPEDRFLLMDVARYKLPPCWVPAELLYRAMLEVDAVSGQSRGFLILQAQIAVRQEGVIMCRWLAYAGPPVSLGTLLTNPDHSLIDQSRHALQNVETTNGDGFGVGWYGQEPTPGVYRDTHPAWNDQNFRHLAEHIHSRLFLSHVRASTGTPVQNTNCHPFTFENWLFQHNGSVPEFGQLKRQLLFDVDPELFLSIAGSTDSELLFFLALTFGLRNDPPGALERTIGHVERLREQAGIERPLYFSAAATDDRRIWAVRYSSNQQSRTLYHSRHSHALRRVDGSYEILPDGAVVIVSEPLDELADHWEEVPESTAIVVEEGKVTSRPFVPA